MFQELKKKHLIKFNPHANFKPFQKIRTERNFFLVSTKLNIVFNGETLDPSFKIRPKTRTDTPLIPLLKTVLEMLFSEE